MRSKSFGSYEQFRNEVLRHRMQNMIAAVDDIADELYSTEVTVEFDNLWDQVDDD